jgi:hypothetical protein
MVTNYYGAKHAATITYRASPPMVENARRRRSLRSTARTIGLNRSDLIYLPCSGINDPAPHGERDGMGAIARAELGQNGLHVSFDGIFRHFEKLPNTFV